MPKYSATSDRVYGWLPEVFRAADVVNEETLRKYLSAVLDQQDQVQKLISRFEYLPEAERGVPSDEFLESAQYVYNVEGKPQTVDPDDPARIPDRPEDKPLGATSDLIDPATADEEWLPFLRQLFPVFGEFKNADDLRAALISSSNNYARGSMADLIATTKQFLTGAKTVQVYKGANLDGVGGSATPWDVLLVTTPGEYARHVEPRRNLATNPSFETTTSTPFEVRRNLASDTRATTNGLASSGQAGWAPRWFGSGGNGTTTAVSGATDGPEVSPGVRIPTYLRKTWTAAGGTPDTGFDHTVPAPTGGLPVVAGKPYTFSSYMRASRNPGGGTTAHMRMAFHDAAGTTIAPIHSDATPLVAGAWVRASITVTAPAGAAFVSIFSDIWGTDSWQVGDTLDGTGLLMEQSPILGPYFDGSTSPDADLTPAWSAAENASVSALVGMKVADVVTSGCVAVRSSRWSKSGTYSMRLIPTGNPGDPAAYAYYLPSGGSRTGKTDTLLATVHLEAPLLVNGGAARMYLEGGIGPQNTANIANVAGDQELRVTSERSGQYTASFFTLPSTRGNGDVWVDNTATIEGKYTGPYFDGSNPPGDAPWATPSWEGAANASTSVLSGPSLIDDITRSVAKAAGVRLHHRYYAATWETLESQRPTWEQWEGFTWETIEKTGM